MAVPYTLTTAEAGRLIDQKIKRGEISPWELTTDDHYALMIWTAVELGTFEVLKK